MNVLGGSAGAGDRRLAGGAAVARAGASALIG